MKTTQYKLHQKKKRRALRVRKTLHGSAMKPRLCVVKTNAHIEVQLINDELGHTLASASTRSKELKGTSFNRKNKESARKLGEMIAEKAQTQNIKEIVFDRGAHKYHGILAELADAARGSGLKF